MLKRTIQTATSALLLIFLLVLLTSCTPRELPREVDTVVPVANLPTKNISYGDAPYNLLDVYLPSGTGPFPVLLLIHGTGMDKDYFEATSAIDDLTENGYASVAIHYREEPLSAVGMLQDTTCALAWIYANSQLYGFDTRNIFLFGHSRGASLATIMSTKNDLQPFLEGCDNTFTTPPAIKGTIAYGGSYGVPELTFSDPLYITNIAQASGLSEEEVTKWLAVLSTIPPTQWGNSSQVPEAIRTIVQLLPMVELDGNEPPFLLVHGELDDLIPVDESISFAGALQNAGVRFTLAILPEMYHRLNQDALHEPLFKFLKETQSN